MIPRRKKYKLSKEFITKLTEITAGYISPENFESVISMFEKEISERFYTFSAESNLLRIILAMYDKVTLLNECIKYPHYVEILVLISVNSNYLTDILVKNPEYFYWIVNPSTLENKIEYQSFCESIKNSVLPFKSFNSKVNALRRLKRKEILRIGMKDIWGKAELKEITEELSALAKSITAELFSICHTEVLNKYSLKNAKGKFCLVALGKLGGNELNYSSDIDLIIFYDEDFILRNKKSYSEILIETIYLFIESASSITSEGYIYRVDFRLRPEGRNSPLSRSLSEYLNYYESRGEDWERQMLIKMEFVSGSKSLFKTFSNFLNPFIYPLSFSSSPTEQIRKLKSEIEKNLTGEDIKLISGGIRDIEFSVQALQLLNGGRNIFLETPNTLEAIEKLQSAKLISEHESKTLTKAYILYRRIEHFLQLMNDAQTHTIPQEGETLEKLSVFLGYTNSIDFKNDVFENRKSVLKIYNSILGIETESDKKLEPIEKINFQNKSKALADLQFMREGKGLLGQKQFDKTATDSFRKIEPALINFLRYSTNPDQVLQNFVRVFRSISIPSIWYKEFENNKFFESFLKLCEFSQFSVDLFAEDESLRENILTRKVFEKINLKAFKAVSAKNILFITSVQFSLGLITPQKVSQILKHNFSLIIKEISLNILKGKIKESEFAIAAMGSFGSGELTFTSDIDLIFVVKNLNSYPDVQKNFQNLLLKFKEELKPIEVDCRLRPEGKSSILVWDLKSYQNYILSRARTWELQAFCKFDFISGNKKTFNELLKSIRQRIKTLGKNNLRKDILDMRKKLYPVFTGISNTFNIKRSRGGIADIEFLIQFILLSDSNIYSSNRSKTAAEIISSIVKLDKNFSDIHVLKDNFLFLKNMELANQIIFRSTSSTLTMDKNKFSAISRFMNHEPAEEFHEELSKIIKTNYSLFEKYLEGKN
ncbi:MAG: nucleotidyltransferase domain-containing protein [Bacteroidetes bacterium]|nr:nucleotidyltransferase domain-containing protein [Bacteroidota bacterium]